MSLRNKLSILLTLLSIGLFFPGIFLPMLDLKLEGEIDATMAQMGMTLIDKPSSIIQSVFDLWEQKLFLVAVVIFAFSVVVPIIKTLLVGTALLLTNLQQADRIMAFVQAIGKWSMCDVFVVAILVTYLSTGADPAVSTHTVTLFGMSLTFTASFDLQSTLGPGFYYFLGYCMTSLLALQIYQRRA